MPDLKILPSILAADMMNLERDCARALEAGADGFHIDVMDGHFVPNISMGPAIVEALRGTFDCFLSVHLMIQRPDRYAERFVKAGGDMVAIQVEAECLDTAETLRAIRAAGAQAGIVVNPETPDSALNSLIAAGLVDEIMCMTVHPGYGGQRFMAEVLPKIKRIRERMPEVELSVDGGVDLQTAPQCAAAGANVLIAGTALFKAKDMKSETATMRKLAMAACS